MNLQGFIIVLAIILIVFIITKTSTSPRPEGTEQLDPYQAAVLVAVVLLGTGFSYMVTKFEEVDD